MFSGNEDFLVLACDGLWDTVGKDQAIELVNNIHVNSRESAAKLLVDAAKNAGSNDNISVVVVYLDRHTNLPHDAIELTQKKAKTNGIIDDHAAVYRNEEFIQDGTNVHKVEKQAETKTNEKYDSKKIHGENEDNISEQTSQSADNSPKHTRKGKSKVSHTKKGLLCKSSNQLGVAAEENSRRKSAPAAFSPS